MADGYEPIEVRCYSGHTYAQEPRGFVWRGKHHSVTSVVRTWRTPECSYFVVETADGSVFELSYREAEDVWLLKIDPPRRRTP